jgi:penicillin-binding protein-related factor A (putative recombinase)
MVWTEHDLAARGIVVPPRKGPALPVLSPSADPGDGRHAPAAQSARQASGAAWEDVLAATHAWYLEQAAADIRCNPVPVKVLGKGSGREVRGVMTEKGRSDFEGVIRGGRFAAIEAKATIDKVRWNLGQVTQGEAQHLELTAALGGLAGVVLFWRVLDLVTWIPVRVVGAQLSAAEVGVLPPDWCSRCASPARGRRSEVEAQIRRALTPVEVAQMGIPEIPSVKAAGLHAFGFAVPWGVDGRGRRVADWLSVALRVEVP